MQNTLKYMSNIQGVDILRYARYGRNAQELSNYLLEILGFYVSASMPLRTMSPFELDP